MSDSEEEARGRGKRAGHTRRARGGLAGLSTIDDGDAKFLDDLFLCMSGKGWDVDRGWDRRAVHPQGCFGVTVEEKQGDASGGGEIEGLEGEEGEGGEGVESGGGTKVPRLVELDLRGNNLKWLSEYPTLSAAERHVVKGLQAVADEGRSAKDKKAAAALEQKILPEGNLPDSLGRCSALRRLDLRRNRIRGTIPPLALGKLRALSYLNLYANCLTGSIPDSIGECRMLVELRLNSNALTGPIPTAISNCGRLEKLYLASNELHGAIPVGLCTLLRLEHLDLRNNDFSGELPAELADLRLLTQLGLSGNKDLVIPETGGAAHQMTKAMIKALEKAKEAHMMVGDGAYSKGDTKPLMVDDADEVLKHFSPILTEKRRGKDSKFCVIS